MSKKSAELPQSETKFNIKLGESVYTLNFGTTTFIRIKETKPELTTAFHVMDEMVTLEAIPFLIDCAIKPEEKSWSNHSDFLELYDDCDDDEAISKVIPAYFSAAGRITKKLTPALAAIEKMQSSGAK